MKHVKHIKYILPADRYIKPIPNYSACGRKTTLRMNPDKLLDLYWNLVDTYHTTNIGWIDPQTACISTHYIDVDTLSHAEGDRCRIGVEQPKIQTQLPYRVIMDLLSALLFIIVKTKCEILLIN